MKLILLDGIDHWSSCVPDIALSRELVFPRTRQGLGNLCLEVLCLLGLYSFVAPTRLCVVELAEVAAHVLPMSFADIAKLLGSTTDMNIIHDVVVLSLVDRSAHYSSLTYETLETEVNVVEGLLVHLSCCST